MGVTRVFFPFALTIISFAIIVDSFSVDNVLRTKCIKEVKIDLKVVDQYEKNGQLTSHQDLKCFVACMMQGEDRMTASGKIDSIAVINAAYPKNDAPKHIKNGIKNCADKSNGFKNKCDVALEWNNCIQQL